jgi:hypothetical protein
MNVRHMVAAAGVALLTAAGTQVNAANLVSNGGFETGDLTGWTTFPTVGTYTFTNTGYNGVRTAGSAQGVSAYAGEYLLAFGNYPSEGVAGVSQTLSTIVGQNYNLSLYWGDNKSNGAGDQLFEVLWNGSAVDTINGETATTWTNLSFLVKGTGSDTLTLEGYSNAGYNDVDNVSVTVTPLPGALSMFGAGLVSLGALGWRKAFKSKAA